METQQRTSRLGRLGRLCARRHVLVVAVAIAAFVAVTVGHRALGGTYSDDFTLPGSAAQHGADLLAAHDPAVGGQGGQLVFTSRSPLTVQRDAIEQAAAKVRALPHVLSVGDPLSAGTTSVFLLTRVRESWQRTGDNHAGVAGGLATTARVISCAALIMASVFLAFLLSTNVVVKILALGLGVSVLIDATVIRLVVVPASMYLFGAANWWTPRFLRRLGIGAPAPVETPLPTRPQPEIDGHERSAA